MPTLDTPLRQVPRSALDDDPFWSTVLREHRDATYVVLPPRRPGPPDDPGQDRAGLARDLVAGLREAWCWIAPHVEAAGQHDAPAVGWQGPAARRRLVLETSLTGIGRDAGVDLLAVVGVRLGLAGWLLRPERLPDRALLQARDRPDGPAVELTAAAGDGATVLCLETPSLPVDAALAAELAEVTSWR